MTGRRGPSNLLALSSSVFRAFVWGMEEEKGPPSGGAGTAVNSMCPKCHTDLSGHSPHEQHAHTVSCSNWVCQACLTVLTTKATLVRHLKRFCRQTGEKGEWGDSESGSEHGNSSSPEAEEPPVDDDDWKTPTPPAATDSPRSAGGGSPRSLEGDQESSTSSYLSDSGESVGSASEEDSDDTGESDWDGSEEFDDPEDAVEYPEELIVDYGEEATGRAGDEHQPLLASYVEEQVKELMVYFEPESHSKLDRVSRSSCGGLSS